MTEPGAVLGNPAVLALGWAVVGALWITTAISLSVRLWLHHVPGVPPAQRYRVVGVALSACCALPLGCFGTLYHARSVVVDAPSSRLAMSAIALAEPLLSAVTQTPVAPSSTGPPRALAPNVAPGEVMSWIAVAWGLVVSMLLLRLAGGLLLTQRLRRRASIIEATDILAAVSRLGIQLGIARPVRVLRSDELRAPATLGWLRPAIILPREFPASLPSDALDSLLAHELGHIHRHDSFAGTFQMIAEALLFHCPGARWLSALARQAREHCCDDIAVGATGDRDGYVAALGALAEFAHAAPALGAASPSLSGRIHRLIKGETMPRLSRPRILALVVGAALTVVAGVATAGGSLLHLLATEERTESTLPIGMIRSQPGAPVSITSRASATGLSDRYAFETIGVRNISEDEVTSLRFVAGVEVVGADPRLSLFESEAFPVALQPGEATEVKIDLLPISELRAIENRAAGHVQASIGVIEAGVSASPSDPWRIVPLRGASTLSDALHIRRPYVTRALVEAAPSGASRSRCRDDGGAVYSEGAILPVKDEPEPSLVYCTSGSWIARNP